MMREIIRYDLSSRSATPGLRDALEAILPEGVTPGGGFLAELEAGSRQAEAVQQCLEQHGRTPWGVDSFTSIDWTREYTEARWRLYSHDELESFQLLELGRAHGCVPTRSNWTSDPAAVQLKRFPKRDISSLGYGDCPPWTLVTEYVREAMVSEGLDDDAVFTRVDSLERPQIPVYILTSRRTMPALSERNALRSPDGSPDCGDIESPCLLVEGKHFFPEMRYRAPDIEAMGHCDLAQTLECFGTSDVLAYRPLLVSRRFYQMCRAHGFNGGFLPVHVDAD